MSHPRRKPKESSLDPKSIDEVLIPAPSSMQPPVPGSTNFISGNYHYAHLLAETGKLGFMSVLGDMFNPTEQLNYGNQTAVPGIMAIDIVPTIGRSDDINSGANLAAKDIFTGIRRNNMGTIPYDPADVMLYMLGIDSVIYMLAFLRRAFRVVKNFRWKNRYTSDALLSAMGIIPSTLRNNYGDVVARYDMIITKAQRLIYLRDFPLLADHAMLFSEIYKDGEDERAQLYVTRPIGYYLMTLLPDNPKRILEWTDISYGVEISINTWLDTVENMINNIAYVNTYSNIAGQIEKSFGPNAATLPLSGDLEPLEPLYNSDFGWILQNATITYGIDDLDIYESLDPDKNLGALICKPSTGTTPVPLYDGWIYTTHDTLSSEEVFQATRWMVTRSQPIAPGDTTIICGTEIVSQLTIYNFMTEVNGNLIITKTPVYERIFMQADANGHVDVGDAFVALNTVGDLTNFKWYPYIKLMMSPDNMTPSRFVGLLGNVDNYQRMGGNQMGMIQDVRQLEAFYMANITTIT